jgi:hypothetical protein
MDVVDSQADRFLRTTDLAKIGWLYLHDGWNVGGEADRVKRLGAAVADAFNGWRRGFQVCIQVVAAAAHRSKGVRLDGSRLWRMAFDAVSGKKNGWAVFAG